MIDCHIKSDNNVYVLDTIKNAVSKQQEGEPVSVYEKEVVELSCCFAMSHSHNKNFNHMVAMLALTAIDLNIEPVQINSTEYDKLKRREKLSAKGKSSYGPQR